MPIIDYTTKDASYINENAVFVRADESSIKQFELENNIIIENYDTQQSYQGVKYQYYDVLTDKWIEMFGYENILSKIYLKDNKPKTATFISEGESVSFNIIAESNILYDWGDGTTDIVIAGSTVIDPDGPTSGEHDIEHNYDDDNSHTITVTASNITYIKCGSNDLTSLDISKIITLTNLKVSSNYSLTSLDLSNNKELEILHCNYNKGLINLDISDNIKLKELYFSYNNLTKLNLYNNINLEILYCMGDDEDAIEPLKQGDLVTAYPTINYLTSLDISRCPLLTNLTCTDNYISEIDFTNNRLLTIIRVGNNNLSSVDIEGLPLIKASFYDNNITNTRILDNILRDLDQLGTTSVDDPKIEGYSVAINNNQKLGMGQISYDALDYVSNLEDRGWSVYYNDLPEQTVTFVCSDTADSGVTFNIEADSDIVYDWGNGASGTTFSGEDIHYLYRNDEEHNITVTAINITKIVCDNNHITSINVTDLSRLVQLNCSENDISTIDLSQNSKLEILNISSNNLSNLNVNNNYELNKLQCYENNINELLINNNILLTKLYCYDNNLDTLDVTYNTLLIELNAKKNNISTPGDIDAILFDLDQHGLSDGIAYFDKGSNAILNNDIYKNALENKGWKVIVNSDEE